MTEWARETEWAEELVAEERVGSALRLRFATLRQLVGQE